MARKHKDVDGGSEAQKYESEGGPLRFEMKAYCPEHEEAESQAGKENSSPHSVPHTSPQMRRQRLNNGLVLQPCAAPLRFARIVYNDAGTLAASMSCVV
jgi:hypothetical protein